MALIKKSDENFISGSKALALNHPSQLLDSYMYRRPRMGREHSGQAEVIKETAWGADA